MLIYKKAILAIFLSVFIIAYIILIFLYFGPNTVDFLIDISLFDAIRKVYLGYFFLLLIYPLTAIYLYFLIKKENNVLKIKKHIKAFVFSVLLITFVVIIYSATLPYITTDACIDDELAMKECKK